jgi:hypothetical protein
MLWDNSGKLLYGSFIVKKHVSVWFAWPEELVQAMKVQKPINLLAVTCSNHDIIAQECLGWENNGWVVIPKSTEAEHRYNYYINCKEPSFAGYESVIDGLYKDVKYKYPFDNCDKIDADRFFELILAKDEYHFLHLDDNEALYSPLILFDDNDFGNMKKALRKYVELKDYIEKEGFPKHLSSYKNNYIFEFFEDDYFPSNIRHINGSERMIIAILLEENNANNYLSTLEKHQLKRYKDSPKLPYLACILTKGIESREYKFVHKELMHATANGDAYVRRESITNGGED